MCAKGTPARVRLSCHCSHVMLGGGALVAMVIVAFVWTHLLLLLGMAGLVVAGTFAAVWYLMRFAQPVRSGARPAHHHPTPVTASPSPAAPALARSGAAAAVSVAAAAQAYVDAAFDAGKLTGGHHDHGQSRP